MAKNEIEFAVFILTHGRPEKVVTYNTIRNRGYTGPIYIIIDNEDKTADKYKEKFGDSVIVFDKKAEALKMDNADNFEDRRVIVYARNATFEIAKKLGVKYWIQFDDDYTAFHYRLYDEGNPVQPKNLDSIFASMVEFYKKVPALTVAMAQGGDYVGGAEGSFAQKPRLKRKAMNSFICSNERPFKFIGRVNEDVNTYCLLGSRGHLFFTIPTVSLTQIQTQSNAGGMTEEYLKSGTYVKSFYTVMHCPSSVKISLMGTAKPRIHHRINWSNTVPLILDEKYRKK